MGPRRSNDPKCPHKVVPIDQINQEIKFPYLGFKKILGRLNEFMCIKRDSDESGLIKIDLFGLRGIRQKFSRVTLGLGKRELDLDK